MKCPKCHFENPTGSGFCSKCGTQLVSSKEAPVSLTETLHEPREELTIGSTFARRYQIIEELGKGGMGKVYKVLDKEVEEKIALKLLKPEIATDEKIIERFRNELKFARKITHKNVCRMYDLSKYERTLYITMEYVSGEDLKSSIKRMGPLSAGKAVFITKQICEGLAEAHKLGVVHRDLKPHNIMIDKVGNARIMDFGIARSLKATGLTGTGVMIGTPEYMSPEQVEGVKVDQRSDIYSLGVILYEMVTGRVPFEGETAFSIALKHKTEIPRKPTEINAQIPEDLNNVILKCMEKDRENRYQNVEEFSSELEKVDKGIPTTDRIMPEKKPSTSRKIPAHVRWKRLLISALIVIALVAAAFVAWRFTPLPEILGISPSPAAPPSIDDYFVAVNKLWKDKNYPEALDQLKKILAIEPKNLEAQLSIANILKEQGKIDEAIPEYEKGIALNNLDPRCYNQLGKIFEDKQELKKALVYYKKYLDTAPKGPDVNRINQKVKDLEVQLPYIDEVAEKIVEPVETKKEPEVEPTKKITPKPSKPPSKPSKIEEEKADLSAKLDLGIKSFNQGNFDQCIKQMEEILEIDPENSSAQYFLSEAKKKKRAKLRDKEIRSTLKTAQDAFQKGDYEECIKQTRRVLKLHPNNAQARRLQNLARLRFAPEQIKTLVGEYTQSINDNNLPAFYQKTCTPQLYQNIKKKTELILKLYDSLQAVASNVNVRFKGINRAEVNFSQTITGVSREDGIKKVLFEGTLKWDMQRQADSWKIVNISSRPIRKK